MSRLDTSSLGGKVALVVGAGSAKGIGFSVASAMSASGATVAIADLQSSRCEELVPLLTQSTLKRHTAHAVDVTDESSVKELVDAVLREHSRIDILVNSAAILIAQPFLQVDADSWRRTFSVNTHGSFLVAQAVALEMVAAGRGGRIMLIASNVGRVPRVRNAAYAASKAAVIHLARSMAMELGSYNITVNAVCPGSTATSMLLDTQTAGDEKRLEGVIKGSVTEWRTGIPLGRLAEPEDQAAMCVFLASEGGRFVSGQTLCVDGAQTYFS